MNNYNNFNQQPQKMRITKSYGGDAQECLGYPFC